MTLVRTVIQRDTMDGTVVGSAPVRQARSHQGMHGTGGVGRRDRVGRCKPDSVPAAFPLQVAFISLGALLAGRVSCRSRMRLVPEGIHPAFAGLATRRAVSSVLSCTAQGLSCAGDHSPAGGLLPRLFTLTSHHRSDEGRYVLCDTFHDRSLALPASTLARGTLPYGVRTFLSALSCDRPQRMPPADPEGG